MGIGSHPERREHSVQHLCIPHQLTGLAAFVICRWRRGILERSSSSEEQSLRKLCGRRRLSYLEVWARSCRYVIWFWALAKHVKGNWVRSFDFLFPLIPLKAWIVFTCFLCFKLPSSHWKRQNEPNWRGADTGNLLTSLILSQFGFKIPNLDLVQLCAFVSRKKPYTCNFCLIYWREYLFSLCIFCAASCAMAPYSGHLGSCF